MSKPNSNRDGSPCKAGPKKIYGHIVKNKQGTIVSGQRQMKSFSRGDGYEMAETNGWCVSPRNIVLKKRLDHVNRLERSTTSNSDPFMFNRMRAHVRAGIETFS